MSYKHTYEILVAPPQDKINEQHQDRIETEVPGCTREYCPSIIDSEEVHKIVFPVFIFEKQGICASPRLDRNRINLVICVNPRREFHLQNKGYGI